MLLLLKEYLKQAGTQMVYAALLLYHAYGRPETPTWAKRMVLGTLAYVLAPVDAIPDLTPFFGFTDDLGVLMFGLVSISAYINAEVKADARKQVQKWFGSVNAEDLDQVERKIG
ncbi:MAG: DUF1232 domain-containing protein [Saprospiraceae bacterium]|nr:DUF1232 domain-containing protein [Saprospiraceae bacterium]